MSKLDLDVLWNDDGPRKNLTDYQSDMDTLISHLNAARSVAVGLYQHNPDSRKVPSFETMYDELGEMVRNLHAAKKTAGERLREL